MPRWRRFSDDDREHRYAHPPPEPASAEPAPAPLPPAQSRVLELQQTAGNQAVSRMLANPVGGLVPGIDPEDEEHGEVVGGVGDAIGVVGSMLGNALGGVVGAATGIKIDSKTNTGPTFGNHGHFDWRVGLNTTAKSGWIVQEVVNTLTGEKEGGGAIPGKKPTPKYYEAWEVGEDGAVTPSVGADNDYWIRPGRGEKTKGHWSMTATCYFTTTDPAESGLAKKGVPDAGILLSGTTAPKDLGIGRLHRYAYGTWDSIGDTPTHRGGARP